MFYAFSEQITYINSEQITKFSENVFFRSPPIHRIYLIHGIYLIRGKYRTYGVYLIHGIIPYTWFIRNIAVS